MYHDNDYHKQQYTALNNGQQAFLLKGKDEYYGNILIWTECDDKIVFRINGKLSAKELINIANNIIIK